MNRSLTFLLFSALFIVLSPLQASAAEPNPWHVGAHYGAINNFKIFNSADTDSGSMLSVDYSYDFNDRYTAALELGYIVDNYAIPNTSSPRDVETATFINLDHIFYFTKTDWCSPYWKIGTGIYAVTLWEKQDNTFVFKASDTFGDIDLGIGSDLKLWGLPIIADLTLPSIAHEAFFNSKMAYIFSIGYSQHF